MSSFPVTADLGTRGAREPGARTLQAWTERSVGVLVIRSTVATGPDAILARMGTRYDGCRRCGGELPVQVGPGRPRAYCYSCKPHRGKRAKVTITSPADPPVTGKLRDPVSPGLIGPPTLGEWQRSHGYDPETRTYAGVG